MLSRNFFEAVYEGAAPWDVGRPQPDMVALLAACPPRDPILDAGCGSGDLSIHLAQLGHHVVGVDFVQRAIDRANHKRADLPMDVASRLTFLVANAARPAALGETFGAVVDSGFLHLLDEDESAAYALQLASVIRPGGRCFFHEFAVQFPIENTPRAVSETELRERFNAPVWRVVEIRPGQFHSAVAPPVPAVLACVERTDSAMRLIRSAASG